MLTLVGLIYRTLENGIERRTPSRAGIGTYMTEVLSIQKIMRRPGPVNQFLRGKSSLL
jgi:hypothetical protein